MNNQNENFSAESEPMYTREVFDAEVKTFFEGLSTDIQERAKEKNISREQLFLNNFRGNLPLGKNNGAFHRDLYQSMGNWEEKLPDTKRLFDAIDFFCSENRISFESSGGRNVCDERLEDVIKIYIYLRSQGFSHHDLTC